MPACHAGDRRFESGRVRHRRFSQRPVPRPDGAFFMAAPPGPVHLADSTGEPATPTTGRTPTARPGHAAPVGRTGRDRGRGRRRSWPSRSSSWPARARRRAPRRSRADRSPPLRRWRRIARSAVGAGSGSPVVSPRRARQAAGRSAAVPIVPVVDFRSTEVSVKPADVETTLDTGQGSLRRPRARRRRRRRDPRRARARPAGRRPAG